MDISVIEQCHEVQDILDNLNFKWEKSEDILNKIYEEVMELEHALDRESKERQESEFGDVLILMICFAKHEGYDINKVLMQANNKVLKRISRILSKDTGVHFKHMSPTEQLKAWKEIKLEEN
jgi:uncharacterized protein YabN with tetrapyrrole methylase and pyrophosphatase domain